MRRLALFLLAWPAFAIPITGTAASALAGTHMFVIVGPDFSLSFGQPDGPPGFVVCPVGPCEFRGIMTGGTERRWDSQYRGAEAGIVAGMVTFSGSVDVPPGDTDEVLIEGIPVTFDGWLKAWASAPGAGEYVPPDEPGDLLVEMRVAGTGTMRLRGPSWGGVWVAHYGEAVLAGDATIIGEATPGGGAIPEPNIWGALVTGLAILFYRRVIRPPDWRDIEGRARQRPG